MTVAGAIELPGVTRRGRVVCRLVFPGVGLGAWRFLLALLVAVSHLWSVMLPGPAAYAVWAFFVLSGFLITLALRERYGFSKDGLSAYARNRFLRIFPPFWLAALLGAMALSLASRGNVDAKALNMAFGLPSTAGEWAFHASLLPVFPRWISPVPVANALSVEVGWYLLMPLIALRRGFAWMALGAGIVVVLHYGVEVQTFADRYALFWPAAPAFTVGALTAHYRHALRRFANPDLSIAIWLLHSAFWLVDGAWPWSYGLYVSIPLSAWVAVSFSILPPSNLDDMLGGLSYPLYLLHSTVGLLLLPWFGTGRHVAFAVVAVACSVVAAAAMWYWVERPLQRFRWRPVQRGRVSGSTLPEILHDQSRTPDGGRAS